MKKFILKSSIYFGLIVAYLLIGEYFLFRIKENVSITSAVKQQMESKEECYYGRTLFSDAMSRYKYEALQYRKPNIIVLGLSNVMNFRDFFFHPFESDFYNTGLMVRNLSDLVYFADLLEQGVVKKPEFMVVGVDYGYVASGNQLDRKKYFTELEEDQVLNTKEHLRSIQTVLLDGEKRQVPDVDYGFGKKGMAADGYRKDGSFSYLWETENLVNDSIHNEGPQLELFIKKEKRYKEVMAYDSQKAATLLYVINKFKKMGIEILIYCPPFSDTFFETLIKDDEFKSLWTGYLKVIDELEAQNYDVIKFTTPSGIGLTDYSMNNADHPGDVMVGKQFYDYCITAKRKNKFINKVDANYLKAALDSPKTNSLSFMRDRWN